MRQLLATFLVTTTQHCGPGSLCQAILDANTNPGLDTIAFQIGEGGPQTIAPLAPLPVISDSVHLDGTTQPGYSGTPIIELLGEQAGGSGLILTAGNSRVQGLVINGFASSGLWLQGQGGNVITGNFIGTDREGRVARPDLYGVRVNSNNNLIGGTTPASRNLVSGNRASGIYVENATGNRVQGNYIGTDVTGYARLGNGLRGVSFWGGSNNTLGGVTPGAGNLIAGNSGNVSLTGRAHVVQGNLIDTDASGTRYLGRSGIGTNGSDHVIGGTEPGAGNVVGEILLGTATGSGIVVQGNHIGVDVTGTVALGGHGIKVNGFNHLIGGTTPEARNLISGNVGSGLEFSGSARLNRVQGNYLGTDVTGTRALPNRLGLAIGDIGGGGRDNLIGGTEPGAGNLISGNTAGLFVGGTDNVVQGNFIGTDVTGTVALPNQNYGVSLGLAARRNLIGGTAPGARNLIAGSRGVGLGSHDDAADNVIQGNYIGTDVTGTRSLPNLWGVVLRGRDNLIGGTEPGAGNLLSGNTYYGLGVAARNVVQGNRIGTDVTGTQPLGNGTHGVSLVATSVDNLVGGTAPGAGNLIAFNGQDGVHIDGSLNTSVRRNRIVGHVRGLGIFNGGATYQLPPRLTAAVVAGGRLTVTGTQRGEPNTRLDLEFFANRACNPSGFGEGDQFLGTGEVTTDAAGNGAFTATFDTPVPLRRAITATATDPAGNTSAFSACQPMRRHARPLPLPLLAQTVSVPYREPGTGPGAGIPAPAVPAAPAPEHGPRRDLPDWEREAVDAAFAPAVTWPAPPEPWAAWPVAGLEEWAPPRFRA